MDQVVIRCNSGKLTTTLNTLKACPNSVIGTMFSERHLNITNKPNDKGEYFLDIDINILSYVLTAMKLHYFKCPNDIDEVLWKKEIDYWQLQPNTSTSLNIENKVAERIRKRINKLDLIVDAIVSIGYDNHEVMPTSKDIIIPQCIPSDCDILINGDSLYELIRLYRQDIRKHAMTYNLDITIYSYRNTYSEDPNPRGPKYSYKDRLFYRDSANGTIKIIYFVRRLTIN